MCSQLRFITSKGHKSKSTEGKGTWGKVWKKPGANFQESFLSGIIQDALNSQQLLVIICVQCCLPGLLIDSALRVFIGGWQ